MRTKSWISKVNWPEKERKERPGGALWAAGVGRDGLIDKGPSAGAQRPTASSPVPNHPYKLQKTFSATGHQGANGPTLVADVFNHDSGESRKLP